MATRKPPVLASARSFVLVHPAFLGPVSSLLREEGWEIGLAASPSALLQAVASQSPSLVLLAGPGVDGEGFKLCRTIKASWSDLPVVLVVEHAHREQQLLALDVGADDILTTPISEVELLLCLRSQLRLKALVEQVRDLQRPVQRRRAG